MITKKINIKSKHFYTDTFSLPYRFVQNEQSVRTNISHQLKKGVSYPNRPHQRATSYFCETRTYILKGERTRRLDRHKRIDKGHIGTLPNVQNNHDIFFNKKTLSLQYPICESQNPAMRVVLHLLLILIAFFYWNLVLYFKSKRVFC